MCGGSDRGNRSDRGSNRDGGDSDGDGGSVFRRGMEASMQTSVAAYLTDLAAAVHARAAR
jgi:hypothetical protein